MNKKLSVLSFVIAIVIFLRCLFDNNENLIYIIAGINTVAFLFIECTIIEKTVSNIVDKIESSNVPEQIREREISSTRFKIWIWGMSISGIIIVLYFLCGCSNLGNDIISILALGVSILDDEIEKKITDIISNIIKR